MFVVVQILSCSVKSDREKRLSTKHRVCFSYFSCTPTNPLVLKARHLSGSAFCTLIKNYIGMPEQAQGRFPLGLGLVVEDESIE